MATSTARPQTPKSNIFCSKNRDICSDTTYHNHYAQKLSVPAFRETQAAARQGRRAAGLPATKTNLFPGTDGPASRSSYGLAFNRGKSRTAEATARAHSHLKPSCSHCMYEAILDSHHFRERMRGGTDASDSATLEQLRGTHFTFGNDRPGRDTVYDDFTRRANDAHQRTRMVSPPVCAEVMPSLASTAPNPAGLRSSLQSDFTYFGSDTSENIHSRQKLRYDNIKTIHGVDSVAASGAGKKDQLQSRSMIDYVHPLRMRTGHASTLTYGKTGNGNIWDLNPNSKETAQLNTENRQNFSWLSSRAGMGFKRFYKGCVSDRVR